MKKMMKICMLFFFLIVSSMTVKSADFHSENVNKKVTVTQDEKGVWFIKGGTIYSTFEAMGYCVAKDRLWQAELYRRNGRGTLSEIFGPDQLVTDIFVRTLSYSEEELQTGFEALDKKHQTIIKAYVDGFNRRIDEIRENPSLLPFEFLAIGNILGTLFIPEDWKETDVLAWGVFLMRQFDPEALKTGQIQNAALLQELAMKFPYDYFKMFSDLRWLNDSNAPTMIPEEKFKKKPHCVLTKPDFHPGFCNAAKNMHNLRKKVIKKLKKINAYIKMGSYAWVVSGSKTASGNPILYSGPQMGFFTPSIVLEGSIKAPGYKVSGMTIAGIPGIIIGRTPHHSWSMQVGHAHTVDYYLEHPLSVIWHRDEIIKIAGFPDITLPVYRTQHGPVIYPMSCDPANPGYNPENPGDTIFSWKYSHWGMELSLIEALFGLGSAHNIEQFGEAIEKMPCSFHFCYADRKGDIAYWMSGSDPIRLEGVDTRFPQIGDGTQEWPEPVTLKIRSHDCNPKQGFYGGWNTKSRKDYNNNNKLDIFYYGPFQRGHVVQDFLSTHNHLSFDELKNLALNIATTDSFGDGGNPWKFVANDFIEAVESDSTPGRLEALDLLKNWDGHFVAGGEAQWVGGGIRADAWVLQNEWILEVLRLTFEDELVTVTMTWEDQHSSILFNVLLHALLGESSGVINQYDWFQDSSLSGKPTTAEEIIVLALDNVLSVLGPRPWNMPRGEIVYVHDILGIMGSTPYSQRSTYAQCVEIGRQGPVRIESMFPLGQSGNINISGIPDDNFFSMKPLFDTFNHRPFPLFNENEEE